MSMNPSFLWDVLERARFDLEGLKRALEVLSQGELERYVLLYEDASSEIREPWVGVEIDGIGGLSEDSTEDYCDALVAQGEEVWRYACSPQASHTALFYALERGGGEVDGLELTRWESAGVDPEFFGWLSPKGMGVRVLELKFGVEYWEELDRIMEEHDPVG